MQKRLYALALASLTAGLAPMAVTPAIAQAGETAHYSVETTVAGTLIDDPAAAAILKKLIPTVWANELFQTQGRALTLRAIQQFEPDALSDANLAKIQAELDKIPPKG